MKKFKILMVLIISLLLSLFINCALSGSVKAEDTNTTEFSNAKIEVTTYETSDYFSKFQITISDVPTAKEGHSYKIAVGNTPDAPEECPELSASLTFDQNSKKYTATTNSDLTKALTYKANKYLYVYEKYYDNELLELVEKVVLDKTEISKPQKKIYSDAYAVNSEFHSTAMTIYYHIPVTEGRKAAIKIGKISDQQILKDIKDNKSDCFANLLNYAKQNSSPIYNENCILDANGRYSTLSQINNNDKLLNINQLEGDSYYYVYTVFDDENGKYDEQYAVTFTQANVDVEFNDFKLNLFGSSDFKWIEFQDINKNDDPVPNNDDPNPDTTVTEGTDFTDFSNAKIETLETISFGSTGYVLHIKDAEKEKKSHTYRYLISDGTTTPEYSDEYKLLKYDSESNIYELMDATEIRNVLQLSRKSYIYVFEKYFDETLRKTVTKLIMDKTEITKINTRLYSDAYSSLSMITNNRVQLIYNLEFYS